MALGANAVGGGESDGIGPVRGTQNGKWNMSSRLTVVFSLLLLMIAVHVARGDDNSAKQWPAWRGPLATGEAPKADPPTEWSEEKNIRWKAAIPGRGHATPIIWGNRVYIQTAVETDKVAPDAKDEKTDDDA